MKRSRISTSSTASGAPMTGSGHGSGSRRESARPCSRRLGFGSGWGRSPRRPYSSRLRLRSRLAPSILPVRSLPGAPCRTSPRSRTPTRLLRQRRPQPPDRLLPTPLVDRRRSTHLDRHKRLAIGIDRKDWLPLTGDRQGYAGETSADSQRCASRGGGHRSPVQARLIFVASTPGEGVPAETAASASLFRSSSHPSQARRGMRIEPPTRVAGSSRAATNW